MANMKHVMVGMTMDEVRELLGPPDKIDRDGLWLYCGFLETVAIHFVHI
jgi:hypothetical protein